MGATEFSTTCAGRDAADAFRRAQEAARYAHGHEGYTGTIAEVSGSRSGTIRQETNYTRSGFPARMPKCSP